MATDKNITMKQFNGTDYDTLYPKTIASQIPDVYSKSYIDSILKNSAKIQTGSYVGTGTYGASNPCTLTFDFSPKLFILDNSNPYVWGQTLLCSLAYDSVYNNHVTTSENSITWYTTANFGGAEGTQFNAKGVTYKYIVLA